MAHQGNASALVEQTASDGPASPDNDIDPQRHLRTALGAIVAAASVNGPGCIAGGPVAAMTEAP